MSRRTPFVFTLQKALQKRKKIQLMLTKRQRFVVSVIILSLALFLSEYLFGKGGIFVAFIISIASDLLLLGSNYRDIREHFSPHLFILPFFYSLSFGLFYFLVPARLLSRLIITTLYGVGLYSLFLSQNIFTVASIRTIALLSSARTVSLIITLISYFFLVSTVFSLRLTVIPLLFLVFVSSFFLTSHSIWSHTLERGFRSNLLWVLVVSLCLSQVSLMIWFWPSSPIVSALFLTGMFYTFVGLSHVWFDKRLFRAVLWEYIWVSVLVFFILLLFTRWAG